jgi:hypothetical protein
VSAQPCPGAYDLGPVWVPAPVHEGGCCERWGAGHVPAAADDRFAHGVGPEPRSYWGQPGDDGSAAAI